MEFILPELLKYIGELLLQDIYEIEDPNPISRNDYWIKIPSLPYLILDNMRGVCKHWNKYLSPVNYEIIGGDKCTIKITYEDKKCVLFKTQIDALVLKCPKFTEYFIYNHKIKLYKNYEILSYLFRVGGRQTMDILIYSSKYLCIRLKHKLLIGLSYKDIDIFKDAFVELADDSYELYKELYKRFNRKLIDNSKSYYILEEDERFGIIGNCRKYIKSEEYLQEKMIKLIKDFNSIYRNKFGDTITNNHINQLYK
ncbi:Hypothetical protein ORPV_406 [Orpheovirus IHUMI-LCC2]|uniref:F-box domain-containing protein n=1 Tax=Orpheovirus IHUMI-LCC2 TaxID=2023057 RepID=A0A2I2L475_9VIRU|nr:Hypothetical protein ORPV_406 [Orpheovirus IHUMI-LCC2]SNW62310.1 Hypothetical protein ORPV_406 [Orpheovirus IHUMI-LCC2]